MILFSENPVKLTKILDNGEIQFINLKTSQVLSRPPQELEDDDNNKHLNYELERLEKELSEYKTWVKKNG